MKITRKTYSLNQGNLSFIDAYPEMRPALDSMMLGRMLPVDFKGRVLEAGCGMGIPALLTVDRCPNVQVMGVDIQSELIEAARENAILNQIPSSRLNFQVQDVRGIKESFDAVLTNPPFHQACSVSAIRTMAHHETIPLRTWIELCLKRVRQGGFFGCVVPTARLMDVLIPCEMAKMGAICIKKSDETPKRVSLTAIKGSKSGLQIL